MVTASSACSSSRGYELVRSLGGYSPHSKQRELHVCLTRHRVVNWGRQTGKSKAAAVEAIAASFGTESRPAPLVWVIAPGYNQAETIWTEIRSYLTATALRQFCESLTNSPMRARMLGGGVIEAKTADDPDRLRGSSVDMAILEEAAMQSDYVVHNVVLPSFNVTRGRLLAISTPKGKNWFHRWALMGMDVQRENVAYSHATSFDNPYADPETIEAMRLTMSEDAFRQEYLAEFVSDGGSVFRRVRSCAVVPEFPVEPVLGKPYVIGVDWAKHHDFTVFMVMDVHARRVVAFDRFNTIDYNVQIEHLKTLARRYNNAFCLMDATNESSIVDICRKEGLRCEGFKFTYDSKKNVVDALVVAIEREEIGYPAIPQLLTELEAFEYQVTRAGNVRMAAPEGEDYYDDCVMSLALAWHAVRERKGGGGQTSIYSAMSGRKIT